MNETSRAKRLIKLLERLLKKENFMMKINLN